MMATLNAYMHEGDGADAQWRGALLFAQERRESGRVVGARWIGKVAPLSVLALFHTRTFQICMRK